MVTRSITSTQPAKAKAAPIACKMPAGIALISTVASSAIFTAAKFFSIVALSSPIILPAISISLGAIALVALIIFIVKFIQYRKTIVKLGNNRISKPKQTTKIQQGRKPIPLPEKIIEELFDSTIKEDEMTQININDLFNHDAERLPKLTTNINGTSTTYVAKEGSPINVSQILIDGLTLKDNPEKLNKIKYYLTQAISTKINTILGQRHEKIFSGDMKEMIATKDKDSFKIEQKYLLKVINPTDLSIESTYDVIATIEFNKEFSPTKSYFSSI